MFINTTARLVITGLTRIRQMIANNNARVHYKTIGIFLIVSVLLIQVYAWAFRDHISTDDISTILQSKSHSEETQLIKEKTQTNDFHIEQFLTENNIKTFDHYLVWFNQNIKYSRDIKDEWLTPQEILERGNGDCEDMAFLSEAVLKHFGYEPRVLAVNYPEGAHVFTLFKKDGRMHVIDNQRYVITNTESLVQVALFLYTKHNVTAFFEIKNDPKTINLLYDELALKKMINLLLAKHGQMLKT